SRRRHTRWPRDWSSDVCSSDLMAMEITSRSVPGTPSAEIATDKTTQPGTPVELPDPMQSRPRRGILRMAPQLTRRNFSSRATERSEERRVGKEWRYGRGADEWR